MKKIYLICGMSLVVTMSSAQGGITTQMLKEIQEAQPKQNIPLTNAIANVSLDDLAKKHRTGIPSGTYFSVSTKSQKISNQKKSGRCWMFSGLNVLKSNFANKTKNKTVEYSQDYLFFWDQLEKSNLFLQGVLETADKPLDDALVRFFFKHPVFDGGTFCGVADLADKYGLVPAEVVPETYSAENTSRMSSIVASKLREYGLQLRKMVADGKSDKDIQDKKKDMLTDIYRILSMTLGEPIKEFSYTFRDAEGKMISNAKVYTPQSFYKETVGKQLNGSFLMLMNDPRREYYKTYEVQYDRHTYDGHNWCYLNLPMEDIEKIAIASLKDSTKMYSSYDVGKQLDRSTGYCSLDNYDYATLFSTTFGMNKAERISTFDSGSTHAMTLSAVDLDSKGNPVKWKVENSWGADWGQKGCLIMTAEWFREYMFRLVVDKKYVPSNLIELSKQKPTLVSPEDPLFSSDM